MDREYQAVKKLKLEEGPSTAGHSSFTKSRTHDENDAMDAAPIYNLNDDCLREIFGYLSKRQLIGIERVCKKWREVALGFWLRKTTLNYKEIVKITKDTKVTSNKVTQICCSQGVITNMSTDGVEEFNFKRFKSILKRCGKNLRTLNLFHPKLFHPNKSLADVVIRAICRYCKNLKHLHVAGGLVSAEGFKMLEMTIAPNLESFEINRCVALTDEILEKLLKKAPKLDKLCISGNSVLSGDCLVKSGRGFKKLKINFCDEIKPDVLNQVLDNSPKLEVCQCSGICTLKALNERPLREHLVKFQSSSSSFFKDASNSSLPFPSLRHLELTADDSLNNEMLSNFHKWFPNLESIDLPEIRCTNRDARVGVLNNDGIKELVKLPQLQSLNLCFLRWLTGDTLVHLAANTNGRIKIMKCAGCRELCDSEMVKFVSLCPNLKYLDVSGCKNITDEFLKGVLDFMQQRTSKEPLKIRISRSRNCNLKKYNKKHPLLVLEEFSRTELDFRWFIGFEFNGLHQEFEIGGFQDLLLENLNDFEPLVNVNVEHEPGENIIHLPDYIDPPADNIDPPAPQIDLPGLPIDLPAVPNDLPAVPNDLPAHFPGL